jgi:translation initiation factor IF-2
MSDELNQEAPVSWEAPVEAEVPAVVEVVSTPAEPEPVVVPEPEPVVVVVSEPEPEPEPEPVVEVVATPEPAAVVEAPAAEEAKSKKSTAAASHQDGEVVVLSKLVLSSKERNSRSVALVQEQLISKGFADADMDKRGWYKENTQKALLEFCGSEGINEATLKKLFSNTKVAIAY